MAKLYNESRYQSFIATADLTGKAGYAVALDGSNAGQVVLANAQTNKAIGILLVEGIAGQRVTVLLSNGQGTAAAVYGGTVAIGDALTPDSTGKLIATVVAADQIVARAKVAGLTGETHEVLLEKGYYHA
jgi:hypothetical protein